MNNRHPDNERQRFISTRVQEDFREKCPMPQRCGRFSMLPTTCEACAWDADKAIEEANEAADRLEKR